MTLSAIQLFKPVLLRRTRLKNSRLSSLFSVHSCNRNRTSSSTFVFQESQGPRLYASLHCGARPISTSFPASHSGSKHFAIKPQRQLLANVHHKTSGYITQPLKSSLSSSAAVVFLCAVVVIFASTSGSSGSPKEEPLSTDIPREPRVGTESDIAKMTGEALAGRPGTLTAEQEESLKQFWVAVLQVFGLLEKDVSDIISETGRARSDTTDSKTPKKKRLSMFRKKDDENSPSTKANPEDDKYGQTKEFHDALANMSPESLRATFWSMVKHDHPDALLLRFLRARKWDVEKALVMMVSTMRWRSSEVHVDDDIMKNGELGSLEDANGSDPVKKKLGHDFLAQMRLGKSFLHGMDKDGRPMCFVRVRLHKQGEQSEESLERYTIFVIESARMILSPPVDTACIVFDMTGFSLANMDYAPVKFMIKCFEANYPESLGVVLVHKAPWVFQGIWKIIRGWLDPVVASKVQFTNTKSEMEAFVPASQIIKELDGSEDWSYAYIEPVPGENDLMKDTTTRDKLLQSREALVSEYENATLDWINGSGDVAAVKTKRHGLANGLRGDYWKLDPYVRARSIYDRVGLIQQGGKLQFYPGKETVAAVPTNGTTPGVTSADDID
ncbi:related to CSR1-phosphatidylinositol transfer protein [Rhynchosporium agropyri]|uniref:Related to CSR1-phosphatidylinositol transfer protein n=1 Tax=Rhynchosporium agropyri TaxID=914238 RepID=A0A1E1KS64_9HELO|nr:related to CSR1-phosphatidylinositol transfer protein [Rhynchosporium agropyri]